MFYAQVMTMTSEEHDSAWCQRLSCILECLLKCIIRARTPHLQVVLVALTNLSVSFALAFNTAVKARRLRLNGGRDFARTLWAQFRSKPRLFFLPPPNPPNEA